MKRYSEWDIGDRLPDNDGENKELCDHCPHPRHEGICGVMMNYPGQAIPVDSLDPDTAQAAALRARVACQCRVEHVPDSFKNAWIRTASGKKFHFLNPSPEEIDIFDIAHHLAQRNRFSGACRKPWSVALHSILGAVLLDQQFGNKMLALGFLLHDAGEFILPDIPSPVKYYITDYDLRFERPILKAICERFNLDPRIFDDPRLKTMDRNLTITEGLALVPGFEAEPERNEPLDEKVRNTILLSAGRHWEHVKGQFLNLFFSYTK